MKNKEEKKEVRLHKRDGTEFVGTPRECAEVLISDALRTKYFTGSPYACWLAQDFCEKFGLSARQIARGRIRGLSDMNNPFIS